MGIYDDILDNAPGRNHVAAGHLHEDLWVSLLREESADLHNVRLAAGDGGIDGIRFIDPVLGYAHIYQAKFYQKLEDRHRVEIVKAFVAAHEHEFPCTQWTLLVPVELAAPELDWLMVGLRKEATKAAKKLKKALAGCLIDHRDGRDLVDLAKRHLSVAAQHLPQSAAALRAALEAERSQRTALENEVVSGLREVQGGMVREREVEARRAEASLNLLNQGWADQIGMIGKLSMAPQRSDGPMLAESLVVFCERRMREAQAAEGLLPGISDHLVRVHNLGRMLQQALAIGNAAHTFKTAKHAIDEMRQLQTRVQTMQLMLFRRNR